MTRTTKRARALMASALGLTFGALAVAPQPAAAASYVVTNTNNSGAGSLRQAVSDANANPGEDVITFNLPDPSTITLTDRVRVTDDVRIEGPGRSKLTITNPTSRVIDVDAGSLYIDSLTIEEAGSNAIIFTSPAGDLEVDDVQISDSANHALRVVSASNVTVTDSDLTNAQEAGFKGDGINAENVSGDILIQDVVASGNEDNFELKNVAGTITMRRVTATSAVDEAADFQQIGSLVIEDSVFDSNNDQVDVNGATGSVTITDTTVSGTVVDDSIEISDVAGGATIERTTLEGGGQAGLDIMSPVTPTTVTVVNSTISGHAKSGVIVYANSTLQLRHSTVVDNGLHGVNVEGGTANISHTILTGNSGDAVDVAGGSATVQYSLLPPGTGFSGAGNVATSDAKLGPLTDNGGPTLTHLPLTGSPAINAGNPGVSSPPSVDQRGETRVVGTIDIGSVEVSATPPPPNRGTISILPVELNVVESVGNVPLTITRTGGSSGSVSVLVSSQNLSAAAPGDFTALSQTVAFANGEAGSKTVQVSIVDDAKVEGDESFKVRLSNATGGVAIGDRESVITILDNDNPTPPPLDPELDAAGRFVPLPPQRLFDTRPNMPAPGPKGKVGTNQTIDVQITGRAGVPSNATAVTMNVTMTASETFGFVTVWPTGAARPNTSNLNYRLPGQVRPNLVTVPIGAGGKVSMYASSPTHLLADVSGYYVDVDAPTTAGRFVSLTPQRIFDTRSGTAAPQRKGKLAANETVDFQVAGLGGLPSNGISAVVMNLTAARAVGDGFVTAYPTNTSKPNASVLNMKNDGSPVANLVVLPLGPDGKLRFSTTISTHLIGDVMGFFTDGSAPSTTDGLFVPLTPARVFDSRPGEPAPGPKGLIGADSTVDFVGSGVGGVPADAAAVFYNVTATRSPGINFITGWPAGLARPEASLLNLGAQDTRPNATILAPGVERKVSLYTFAGAHLLVDSFGYYLG